MFFFFGRSLTQQGIFFVLFLHFVQCRRSLNKVCSCLGIRRENFDKFHGIQELRSRLHETHGAERGGGRGQELRLRIEEKNRSMALQSRSFLNWRIMLTEKKNIPIFSMWRGLSGQVEIKFLWEDARIYLMGSKFNKNIYWQRWLLTAQGNIFTLFSRNITPSLCSAKEFLRRVFPFFCERGLWELRRSAKIGYLQRNTW